jgi:DNA-binding CsgD family transcriptional regulator
MEHLILAVYAFLFMSGSACLIVLAFLRSRLRSRIVTSLFGVQGLMLSGLALVLTYFYFQNIVKGPQFSAALKTIGIASTLVQTGLYVVGFRMIATLRTGSRFFSILRVITKTLCGIVVATSFSFALFSLMPSLAPAWLNVHHELVSAVGYILVGLTLAALGLVLAQAPLPGEHKAIRLLVRGWGFSLIGFAPLSAIEWALEAYGPLPYAPLSLDFFFYMSCNIVSVVAFARSLKTERGIDQSPLFPGVTEETAARFGLTARERDLIPLIARGLANKEIAAELGISSATVRTHIYNLFQKVGASGRIEFLNKLVS